MIVALGSVLLLAAAEPGNFVDLSLDTTALQIPRPYIVNYTEGQKDFDYLWLKLPIAGYVNPMVSDAPMNVECIPADKDLLNRLSLNIREQRVAALVSTQNEFRVYRGNYGAFLGRTLFLQREGDAIITYANCRGPYENNYTCSINLMVAPRISCEYSLIDNEPVRVIEVFSRRLKEQFRGFLKE